MERTPGKGLAIASMVLGIVSLVLCLIVMYLPALICAIVGLILGIMAKKKIKSKMATAGFVCSLIGLIISAVVWISCVACASAVGNAVDDSLTEMENMTEDDWNELLSE